MYIAIRCIALAVAALLGAVCIAFCPYTLAAQSVAVLWWVIVVWMAYIIE